MIGARVGGGGEALEEEEEENEERPGAGRAVGGLEGGGSLPALLDEGEEQRGEEEGKRKGFKGEDESMRLDKSSRGRVSRRRKREEVKKRRKKLKHPVIKKQTHPTE